MRYEQKGCIKMTIPRAQDILDFWFGSASAADYGRRRDVWFTADAKFDAAIRSKFMADYVHARDGDYDAWADEPFSCLALIILLDQFPRNMFRGTPQAFATDAKALSIARGAIENKYDEMAVPVHRVFFYLPFEHSERLEHQHKSVELFHGLPEFDGKREAVAFADKHHDAIELFGRFPHRNGILGRTSAPEEVSYLKKNGGF